MNDIDHKRERAALTKNEIRHIQLEGLKMVKATCEEHGLTYFLGAGTLLGAVRHKGFIPWDDDTDVSLPFPDYKKLLEIWPRFIDEDWEFRHYMNMDRFFLRHADLCSRHVTDYEKNGKKYNRPLAGCGVDIFPLFFTDNRDLIETVKNTFAGNKKLVVQGKITDEDFNMIHRWTEMIMEAHWSENPDAYATGMGTRIWRKRDFVVEGKDKAYLTFEGEEFCVPADYDAVLRGHYGDDYMTPVDYQRNHGECFWK